MSPVVPVEALVAELSAGARVRLLDVRWRLDRPEGRPEYLSGHLPGAVYVDLERELARPGRPEEGRHPLPDVADLEAAARRWGLEEGDRVVVYDDNDGVPAARAWWLLRRHGVDVRVLDGGFRAWVRAGLRLEHSDRAPRRGRISLPDAVLDESATIDDAAIAPRVGVLVDARAPQHYRGQNGGLDPVAGHIPGAVNIPTISHIGADGRLRDPADIRATLEGHGIGPHTPVVLYCSSGIPSTHSALAFAVAGIRTRVFVGSWSQWARSLGRPVAVGAGAAEIIGAV
ncbi:sulfurtransferase [Microbacterium telephonicum]|uniref:Thiosulfate/3-mercaptopyruvate sulfurtransferase n=1 Tax=Microbacterium telephonicum TaxID=1714841 RepID=A0A498CBV5_9MICO|nr:sulfurtransferase [Microbacterium telephonicum]RLK52677.1 thiosulfate/3-mercaptopyruvate sulfurtransferase [Microbacterium telephonicum]